MTRVTGQRPIQDEVQKTNFSCEHCGSCCREIEPGSNIVMVSPAEVRRIMEKTGFSFEDIAEPYPDMIREGECEYTFEWAVRRIDKRCIFWEHERCLVYEARPWICRTYPFMLNDSSLEIYPCPGIRNKSSDRMDPGVAAAITTDLKNRQTAEHEEEKQIRIVMSQVTIPPQRRVVIDGEGMKILPWHIQ